MAKKRMFQVLDEMNLCDTECNTRMVAISNTFLSANKVKQGTEITMGADSQSIFDLETEKYIPILILVDKDEYFKRLK